MDSATLERMNLTSYHEWGGIDHMLYLMKYYDKERRKWEDWLTSMVMDGERLIAKATKDYARHKNDFKRLVRWNNESFDRDFSIIGNYMALAEVEE